MYQFGTFFLRLYNQPKALESLQTSHHEYVILSTIGYSGSTLYTRNEVESIKEVLHVTF
jgi:hypothetical protein